MSIALYFAALLAASTGVAHSYLGERYILMRLFRRDDLPRLFGSSDFTVNTLRFAWHLTSIAWWGLAALIVLLAHPPLDLRIVGMVVGTIFLLQFAVALMVSRGKHWSWVVFLLIGIITVYATRA